MDSEIQQKLSEVPIFYDSELGVRLDFCGIEHRSYKAGSIVLKFRAQNSGDVGVFFSAESFKINGLQINGLSKGIGSMPAQQEGYLSFEIDDPYWFKCS